MPSYFDPNCQQFTLSQRLVIPTTPTPLAYVLSPTDLTFEDVDAGANLSIKYARFTREVSAVSRVFTARLAALTATDYRLIAQFAEAELKQSVMTTGQGSITLFWAGEEINNLYIKPPITKSESVFNIYSINKEEIFDEVSLTLVDPKARWF